MSPTATPSLGERLRAHWLAQGLALRAGVRADSIRAFETRYGIHLPEDLRNYLAVVNGTGQSEMDDEGYCFWSLEQVKPLNEERPSKSQFQEAGAYFLFADHLLSCPAYAIRLSCCVGAANIVLAIYLDNRRAEAHQVANSFTHFVERYFTEFVVL